ncbi:MAG: TetR/AcrR family transcriptional regulator [Actinobacteria bacterium]|nr:TetR/AcrR family transcriptional regulator [Actinomycetota bacterium]
MSDFAVDPGASKGERTREAVLRAAIAQFAVAGRRGTSVPSIARQVGITPSAVYVYFPTKQELFEAAVDTDVAELINEAIPDLVSGTFDGDFARIFGRLLEAVDEHPLSHRLLLGAEGIGAERLAQTPAEGALIAGIVAAIRDGQRAGTVRDDIDADDVAMGLWILVVSLLSMVLQAGGAYDPAYGGGVVAVLDAAIRPPRGNGSQTPRSE